MTLPTAPIYKKKEKLTHAPTGAPNTLDESQLIAGAQKLRQVLSDPNRKPVMEEFIELEE
ncbi:MAG: hypothetical protein RL748_4337 [Pseudomonadota bacterium]|jgi:hypothetical protein